MNRKSVILLVVCLSMGRGVDARDRPYRVMPFSPDEPLCSATISNMVQDDRGFIWFGTPDGIDRYDCSRTFHVPFPEKMSGFSNVRTLCDDAKGRIWVGSFTGICYWDRSDGRIHEYSRGSVSRIIRSSDGALWVAGNYAGFLRIDPETLQCDTLSFQFHNASAHFGEDVCFDGEGTIWFLNGVGALYRCPPDARELELVVPYEQSPLSRQRITKFVCIDGILCCGRLSETYFYDTTAGEFSKAGWGTVLGGFPTGNGGYMVAAASGLVMLPDGLHKSVSSLREGKGDGAQLVMEANLSSVLQDRDGLIWLGTADNGVVRLLPNDIQMRTIPLPADAQVNAIVEGGDKCLYIGTADNGLLRYTPATAEVGEIPLPSGRECITGLGLSSEDQLIIATQSRKGPLMGLNLRNGQVRVWKDAPVAISQIVRCDHSSLWIGDWLQNFNLESGTGTRVEQVRTTISRIVRSKDGSVWFGTSFSGLWRLKNGHWTHYTDSLGFPMRITALSADAKGRLWIGSPDDGLCCLYPDAGRPVSYPRLGGKPVYRIRDITVDNSGCVWAAVPSGLAALDPEGGKSVLYGEREGFGCTPAGYRIVFTGSDGLLYLVGTNGVQSLDPLMLRKSSSSPRVPVFTGLWMLPGQSVSGTEAPVDIDSMDAIHLGAGDNSFNLDVSPMDYSVPPSFREEYLLEGWSEEWLPVNGNRVTLTNLRAGNYRFHVRVVDREGNPTGVQRSLGIQVNRPFYATTLAIFLYVLFLVAGVIAIVLGVRRHSLRKASRQATLDAEIKDAENRKNIYATKMEMLTTIAHEIRTPLTLVTAPAESLRGKLSRSSDKSVIEDIDTIHSNAEKLSSLLDELLDFRRQEKSHVSLQLAEQDVSAIVRAVFSRFELSARRRNIKASLSLPEEPLEAAVDKNALDKIVSNLLSNAVKYAASRMAVSLAREGDAFKIMVENDGESVPKADRERIFLAFERAVAKDSAISGTGIGLFVSRNLTELHSGTLVMDDDTRVNRFIVTIPIVHLGNGLEGVTDMPEVYIPQEKPVVLVVEDNEEMLDFIARQLAHNYSVRKAGNGKEALHSLASSSFATPDCIISDVMMPQMDGFEFCKHIKENMETSHIPLVLLTARADADSRLLGLEYGADAYISKPFSPSELLMTVKNLIENRERLRQKFSSLPVVHTADIVKASPDAQLLRTIDAYINQHLTDESLSVESLASEVCLSVSSLFKKMKRLVGMGPSEFILLVRLRKGAQLLTETSLPIAEVASMTGYRSTSYFSSSFKNHFGISPKQYRLQSQKSVLRND